MAILGLSCKMYRNTGTWASPTWSEITIAKDVTFSLEKGKADGSRRGVTWRQSIGTLKDAEISMELVHETGDSNFTALRSAFLNGTIVEILVLDGSVATSGSEGLRAEMEVFSFSRAEPLEDVVMDSVTLAPSAQASNDPVWYTVP